MRTYEVRDVFVIQGMVASVPLVMCSECGVPVLDEGLHDEWHDGQQKKILHAGRNAGLLDRIG
jgi:hypothetical protein